MNVHAVVIDSIRKAIERRCLAKINGVVRLAYIMPDGTLKYLKINNRTTWFSIGGAKNAFQAEFSHFFYEVYNKTNHLQGSPTEKLAQQNADWKKFWKDFWQKNIVEIMVENNVV